MWVNSVTVTLSENSLLFRVRGNRLGGNFFYKMKSLFIHDFSFFLFLVKKQNIKHYIFSYFFIGTTTSP